MMTGASPKGRRSAPPKVAWAPLRAPTGPNAFLRAMTEIRRRAFGDGNLMLRIEMEEETDGRFIVEVPDLPGVMAYGQSRGETIVKVEALALRVVASGTR
jgi:hypothetical protein